MTRLTLTLSVLAMILLAACNQADEAPATQSQTAARTTAADSMETATASESTPAGPITLTSGEQVEVISVGYFDENMKSLDGLVAIEGRVKECYAERGALILIDSSVEAGCTDGCCPEAEVPVRLDMSNYSGELPAADEKVVLVGDLTVLDMGYELAVREIRSGEDTLLALKS